MIRPLAHTIGALSALLVIAEANPLEAPKPPHPVFPGIERLAAPEAETGRLLLGELNCTACHAAPEAWRADLVPSPGPNLAGVGSRLGADALARMIRDPHATKAGTRMPRLLGKTADDDAAATALVEYLASLKQEREPMPVGDAKRGQELYHKVGCVACHAPEKSTAVERSVPLALARDYAPHALAHFLHDPLRDRPSGRMPSLHLTKQESADIAAYLQPSAPAIAPQKPDPALIARGREHFSQLRCASCHDTGEQAHPAAAAPLAELSPDRGCLAPPSAARVPHFSLRKPQRLALTAALRSLKAAPTPVTAAQQIDAHFARLNCSACHSRNGKGGPEAARAPFFTTNDGGAESLGEMGHLPPKLDIVGRKLTRAWFEKILWGEDGAVRPYLNTRMPNFGRTQTEPLIALLESADVRKTPLEINVSGLLGHHRAEPGRKLLGAGGLACVSCHGLKERKSLGPPVIRLTHTVARLRPEYFKELLLDPQGTQPGTVMPPLFTGRKDASKEVETIWTYLKELDSHPLPEGLFSDDDYELKPAALGRPIVFRSFIEGAGTHAIGVGFPEGLNACFDAKTARWTQVWKGRFLDAISNYQDRTMKPIRPLGTDVKPLPPDASTREYRGYRLGKDGVPTFLYRRDGRDVEDTLRPAGATLEHIVKVDGVETREVLSW